MPNARVSGLEEPGREGAVRSTVRYTATPAIAIDQAFRSRLRTISEANTVLGLQVDILAISGRDGKEARTVN
jgi:hypothetical protein